ncbi:MAG: glycosyltransferase family 4 protein [Rhodanobacteraceae bacterium]|nr:glycosyltransferase family 4 protein [Rhodanobacteraceae bacterium]
MATAGRDRRRPGAGWVGRLAIELGISERVVWLGRQSNATARQWMLNARVLVVPSSYEQWGLVTNEAWQSGLPVLGSCTVGALRAALPASLTWTMLPLGDVEAWSAALRRVASIDDVERQDWIEIGHDLAQRYSIRRHVESALHLLDLQPRPRPWFSVGLLARGGTAGVVIW